MRNTKRSRVLYTDSNYQYMYWEWDFVLHINRFLSAFYLSIKSTPSLVCNGMAGSLPGWERFFEELGGFIRACNRQSGTANQSFAEYALERIETSIRSVSSLVDHIENATPNSSVESTVLESYSSKLSELLSCLRELSLQW